VRAATSSSTAAVTAFGRPSHVSTRRFADWVARAGLDPVLFRTRSLRRMEATLIYRRTGGLRAVQLLPGHAKIESTVRYLSVEVHDAIAIAANVDV